MNGANFHCYRTPGERPPSSIQPKLACSVAERQCNQAADASAGATELAGTRTRTPRLSRCIKISQSRVLLDREHGGDDPLEGPVAQPYLVALERSWWQDSKSTRRPSVS